MRTTPFFRTALLSLLLAATTLTWAKPAYVGSTVNLRAAPGTTNPRKLRRNLTRHIQ